MVLDVDLDPILTELWPWGEKKLKLEKITFLDYDFKSRVTIFKPIFPKGQNKKVSVFIGKIIESRFQNSPSFNL